MVRNKKRILYVDGYNIINSWDELKDLLEIDLAAARESLIDHMAEYHSMSGEKVIVVFDAHMVKGSHTVIEKRKGIDIVYTRENESADKYIERTIDRLGKLWEIRVATSDGMIQQIVLGRGATRTSAQEIKIEIESLKKSAKRRQHQFKVQHKNIVTVDESTKSLLDAYGETLDD